MTKEERQKYKELTKVLPKMLKDNIKKYKFKKKDFRIWYSTKAVSYTHLDVYKRQSLLFLRIFRLPNVIRVPRGKASVLSAKDSIDPNTFSYSALRLLDANTL